MKRFIAIALVLFTIGCASKVAPSLSVPTQISTLTSNPPLVPSSTAPKSSVTLKPTRTPIATSTPRPTASTFLDIRTPTIEQLSNYLQSALEGFPGWDSNTQLFPEDVNNDGKPDSTKREEDGTLILAIVYADVSGDKQDDIIVFGYDGLIILLWDDNHYNKPFWIPPSWSRGGLSALEVSFQDWTNDGTAEIVHDSNTVGGGTGLWEYNTIRSIIHCQANGCASIWVKLLSQSTDDYNLGGLKRWRLEMQHDKTMDGKPFIRTIDEGFYIYCCIFSESENSTSLNVLTSTLSIYTWTGDVFELTDEQIVTEF